MARFVQDPETLELIPYDQWCQRRYANSVPHYYIMGDIEPYQSMITGELIKSRSAHREHLRFHGKEEVGNDRSTYNKILEGRNDLSSLPGGRKEEIFKAFKAAKG